MMQSTRLLFIVKFIILPVFVLFNEMMVIDYEYNNVKILHYVAGYGYHYNNVPATAIIML